MRTTQYTLILVTQIVLLGVMFTVGAKVVDLSMAKTRAENTCEARGQSPAVSDRAEFRQLLRC